MKFSRKMKSLAIKAFMGGEWRVAYRRRADESMAYQRVDTPTGTWAADPFLFEAEGEHWLFVELFDRKKNRAGIGCYRFIDDTPSFREQCLNRHII